MVSAQSDWAELYPMPRIEYAMSMIEQGPGVTGQIVMFGGQTDPASAVSAPAPLGDTWIWQGGEWSRHKQSGGPQRRNAAAMCRGPNGTLVLFGGLNAGQVLNDTWTWDGQKWTYHLPAVSPSPRDLHAMAYDAGRGVVVMFGGTDGSGNQLSDTWEWNGTTWTQQATQGAPSAREGHVLLYCAANSSIYLHGGWGGAFSSQLYRFDAMTPRWNLVANTSRAVAYHYGDYDPGTGRIVLGGGQYFATGSIRNNTLGWLVTPSNSSITTFSGHAMAVPTLNRYGMTAGDLDGNGHKFYLFKGAGSGLTTERSSTQEFHSSGTSWSSSTLQRFNGPPNTHGGAMVYDETRDRMVLVTGARYVDASMPNAAHPCNQQDPPTGTRASNGWVAAGGSVQCGSATFVPPRIFDDFIGDWSRAKTRRPCSRRQGSG
ncbi:MAG: kelch repeat-containing protein, partial [bacterium]|nr:kelch repeat-containing protein [bacterium]